MKAEKPPSIAHDRGLNVVPVKVGLLGVEIGRFERELRMAFEEGIERIGFMPASMGGPNSHIAGALYDHQLFKGDWLHYGRVRSGKLEFEGLFSATDDY